MDAINILWGLGVQNFGGNMLIFSIYKGGLGGKREQLIQARGKVGVALKRSDIERGIGKQMLESMSHKVPNRVTAPPRVCLKKRSLDQSLSGMGQRRENEIALKFSSVTGRETETLEGPQAGQLNKIGICLRLTRQPHMSTCTFWVLNNSWIFKHFVVFY